MNVDNLHGQTLGQYQLRSLLGAGGMGSVYRALQPALKREVAVKVLSVSLASQPGYIDRFSREAEIAASLEHAHIVPVYDYGVENSISYVVMRLLNGGSLAQRLSQCVAEGRPLPSLGEASALLKQVAGAMDYAHSRGVIHRDIKPGNIMFDNHGLAYLVDFGIAKLLNASTLLTLTHSVSIGTPTYMPPEQWRGDELTSATDQYALAVTIYSMLTGRLPFEAETPYQIMHKHLYVEPTPPRTWRSDIPAAAEAVFTKALAKEPGERFESVTAFSDAFDEALGNGKTGGTGFFHFGVIPQTEPPQLPSTAGRSQPRTPTQSPPKRRRSYLAPAIMVVLLAVALLVVYLARPTTSDGGPAGGLVIITRVTGTPVAAGGADATPTVEPPATDAVIVDTTVEVAAVVTSTSSPTPEPTEAPTVTPLAATTPAPTDIVVTEASDGVNSVASTAVVLLPGASDTPSPEATVTDTASATPTERPTVTSTERPTVTSTERPTALSTDDPTSTSTDAPTEPPTETPSPTPLPGPTLVVRSMRQTQIAQAASATAISSPTSTATATPSATATVALSPTATLTASATSTTTVTMTPSPTPTDTPAPTDTSTPTNTPSPTSTFTASPTPTPTTTPTVTPTPAPSFTPTTDLWATVTAVYSAFESTNAPAPTSLPTEYSASDLYLTAAAVQTEAAGLIPGGTEVAGLSLLSPVTRNADWQPLTRVYENAAMVLVPAGCFTMGSSEADIDAAFTQCEMNLGSGQCQREWFEKEGPATQICFADPFWIDETEVTNAQFGDASPAFTYRAQAPREMVDWFDAQEYCQERGGRLPTEAEWEYAARGPDGLTYPWSNDFVAANSVYLDTSGGRTQNVGEHPAGVSWVGAHDLSGNLREWTSSLFMPYPYTSADGRENLTDHTNPRAVRGGSWFVVPVSLRASDRTSVGPDVSDWNIGFRCVHDFLPADIGAG